MRALSGVFVQLCAAAGACGAFAAACQLVAGVGERTFHDGDASVSGNSGGGSAGGGGVSSDSGSGGIETDRPDVTRDVEAAPPDVTRGSDADIGAASPDGAPEGAAGQSGVADAAQDGSLAPSITVGFDSEDVLDSFFFFSEPAALGAGSWGWAPGLDPHIVQLENVPFTAGTTGIYKGPAIRDGRVSVRLWTTDPTPIGGVVARYVDQTHYYRVSLAETELAIYKYAGTDQLLACTSSSAPCNPIQTIDYVLTNPHTVMFEFIGPDLRFYVNGVLMLQFTESIDSGVPASGGVGIYCASMSDGHFDDFTVESLDGQ